jgi:hypothetical protein
MAIGSPVREHGYLIVRDHEGRWLFSFFIEPGVVMGHTETTVTIREGSNFYTYDERGNRISSFNI